MIKFKTNTHFNEILCKNGNNYISFLLYIVKK